MRIPWVIAGAFAASAASFTASRTVAGDPAVPRAGGFIVKKAPIGDGAPETREPTPLLGTLVQVHTGECVVLDDVHPSVEQFSAMLRDRVTGSVHPLNPKLLELLRKLAKRFGGARIELVSGFRSPKLNEMLRKKGHHVASHSQHSLGSAVDFRIVPKENEPPLEPKVIEREVRELGFEGGVGIYPRKQDFFVHADVGRNRRWVN